MIKIREGEKILSIYRRHKFIIFMEIFPLVFFSFIIIALAYFLNNFLLSDSDTFGFLIYFVAFLFLHMFWIISFIAIADYYLDVWIVTNKRIITVEQKNLFSRIISEFEYSKIQEISVDVHGFIPTMLNYGDVKIRTASENNQFIFKQVDDPNSVKEAINKASIECRKEHYG